MTDGEGWRCGRCGQHWDAARLRTVAAYQRWSLEHDPSTPRDATTRAFPPPDGTPLQKSPAERKALSTWDNEGGSF